MKDARIEIAAEAMWANRAAESGLGWDKKSWRDFSLTKPDIAEIYRVNARVAVEAIDKSVR